MVVEVVAVVELHRRNFASSVASESALGWVSVCPAWLITRLSWEFVVVVTEEEAAAVVAECIPRLCISLDEVRAEVTAEEWVCLA